MGCQGVSSHPRSGAAGPAWLLPSNKLYHSPDPFHHLLTYLLLANIHPQTCPYSANSQVTGNPHPKPAPAESRVTCVPPHPTSRDERGTSCFLRQGRLLAEQQEQGKVRVTQAQGNILHSRIAGGSRPQEQFAALTAAKQLCAAQPREN